MVAFIHKYSYISFHIKLSRMLFVGRSIFCWIIHLFFSRHIFVCVCYLLFCCFPKKKKLQHPINLIVKIKYAFITPTQFSCLYAFIVYSALSLSHLSYNEIWKKDSNVNSNTRTSNLYMFCCCPKRSEWNG